MLRAVVQRILDCGMNDIVRKRPWTIKLVSHCSNLFDDYQLHIVCCTWSLLSCELPFLHKRYYLTYATPATNTSSASLLYPLSLEDLLAFLSMNACVISPHQYKETFLSPEILHNGRAPQGRHVQLVHTARETYHSLLDLLAYPAP